MLSPSNSIYTLKQFWLVVVLLTACLVSVGQIQFPVNGTFVLVPPYTPFVSDYFDAGVPKLNATLVLRDFSVSGRDVSLQLRIEADNGFTLVTKPNFKPLNPITLTPGVPYQVSAADWAEYFNFSNTNISGVNVTNFTQNGVFPEGFYTFYLTVLDYNSGVVISNEARASGIIRLGGVPVVIKPAGNFVVPREPQNIVFQWMMSAPPVDPATTEYSLKLYEITSEGIAPEVAITSGNALEVYQSNFSPATVLQYDASATALELGKRYVYQVQVQDASGTFLFNNQGLSEPYWFEYGYPTGGNVELVKPENEYKFNKDDLRNFSWKVPDNKAEPSQPVRYLFKVVQLNDASQDPAQAISQNTPFYTEESTETPSLTGWETIVDDEFKNGERYAWQVTAFSGEQQVAQSEIRIFHAPPLLTEFRAGDHLVTVLELENTDLTNLKGKGRVKMDRDGSKTVDLSFDSLRIDKVGNLFALASGKLEGDLLGFDDVVIKPLEPGFQDITFTPNGVRLDKNKLQLRGTFDIPFDLPLDGSEPNIITDNVYANYNNFVVTGGVPITATFKLLDPLNFTIVLDTNTVVNIGNEGYRIAFYGNILPPNVFDFEGKPLNVPFINRKQIDYIVIDAEADDVYMRPYTPIPNSEFTIQPKRYIIDFTDKQSGGGKDKTWKGVLVDEYKVIFGEKLDKDGKFTSNGAELSFKASETNSINELTSTGLNMDFDEELGFDFTGTFNSFPCNFTQLQFKVQKSEQKGGTLKGEFLIPVISSKSYFTFHSELTATGFRQGVIQEDLTKETIYFGKENPSTVINYKINQAVLRKDYIDMNVDIYVQELDYTFKNCKDFFVYGNYQVGFGGVNGAVAFDKTKVIQYKGNIELNIDRLNAMYVQGKYYAGLGAYFSLSEDIRGEDGPLGLELFAGIETGEDIEVAQDYSNPPVFAPSPKQLSEDPKEVALFDSTYYVLDCKTVFVEGMLTIQENVPEWGTVFSGSVEGYAYVPSKMDVGGKILSGKLPDGMKYWIANIYAMDDGIGTPLVPGVVNMVAMEGMFFRHMVPTVGNNGKSVTLKPGKKVEYGAGLYVQLIDAATFGVKVKSDLGLELVVEKNDFEVKFLGEATIFNLEGRKPVGSAADVVVEDIVKEATQLLNNACLEEGGWKFCTEIDADLKGGMLAASNNGITIKAGGKVEPGVGRFYYDDAQWLIDVSAGKGVGALQLNKKQGDAFSLGLAYLPGDSAGLNLSLPKEKLSIGGAYYFTDKAASMRFAYGDVAISAYGNKAEKAGHIKVKPNNDFRIETAFSVRDKEASLLLQHKQDEYSIAGAARGYGKVTVKNGSKRFETMFDKDKKEALFTFEEKGDFLIDLYASPDTGRFIYDKEGEMSYAANFNKQAGSGGMRMKFDEKNQYAFRINTTEGSGYLLVQNPTALFELGASKTASSGFVNMNLNSGEKLKLNANLQEKTGLFDLNFSQGHYIASLHTDSAYFLVEPKSEPFRFEIGAHQAGRGLARFDNNGEFVHLKGDKAGFGFLDLKLSGVELMAQANKNAQTAAFRLDLGTDTMNMNLDGATKNAAINTYFDGIYAGAYVTDGVSGGVMYDDQTRLVQLGAGKDYALAKYQEAGNLAFIESNVAAGYQIGRGILNNDSIRAFRDLNTGAFSLMGAYGAFGAGVSYNGSDEGQLNYKDNDRSISALANKAKYGFLSYQEGSSVVYLNKGANDYFKMRLKNNNDSVHLVADKPNETLFFASSFDNIFSRLALSKAGNLQFRFFDGSMRWIAEALNKQSYFASFTLGADSMSLFADLDLKTSILYANYSGIKYYLGRPSLNGISAGFEFPNYSTDVLIDADGLFSFNYQGGDYAIELSGPDIDLPKLNIQKLADAFNIQALSGGGFDLSANYANYNFDLNYLPNGPYGLGFKLNGYDFSADLNTAGLASISLLNNGVSFKAVSDISTQFLEYSRPDFTMNLTISSLTITTPSELFTMTMSGVPNFTLNGISIAPINGQINVGNLTLTVNGGLISFADLGVNLTAGFNAGNISISLPLSGEQLSFSLGQNGVDFSYGNVALGYEAGTFDMEFSTDFALSFSNTMFDVKYGQTQLAYQLNQSLDLSIGDYNFGLSTDAWTFSNPDVSISLKAINEALINVGSDISFKVNTTLLESSIGDYDFSISADFELGFSDGLNSINLSEQLLSYSAGDLSLSFDIPNVTGSFTLDNNRSFSLGLNRLALNYNGYRGVIGLDSLLYLNVGDYDLSFSEVSMKLNDFKLGNMLEANFNDPFIAIAIKDLPEFKISPVDLTGGIGDIDFGLGINADLSLDFGDYAFKVDGLNLDLSLDDFEIKYFEDFKIQTRFKNNIFYASIPEQFVKATYAGYEAGAGLTQGVWYKDDVREGLVDWEKVFAKYGDRAGTVKYIAEEIELIDGARRTFEGSTKHIAFIEKTISDGNFEFELSEATGLRYEDPWNKFIMGNDLEVSIKKLPSAQASQALGELSIGIKNLIAGEKEYFLMRKAGDNVGGGQGVAYSKANGFKAIWQYQGQENFVSVGGELNYFGAKLFTNELYARQDYLFLKRDNYGLAYGGSTLGAIFYDNDTVKLSNYGGEKGYEVEFKGGDKGVAVNQIGEVTIINKGQRIIAGGDQPMVFEDPNSGVANKGDSKAAFGFNIAGIADFNVVPVENNDVKVNASTPFASFGLQTFGQGRLTCEVFSPSGLGSYSGKKLGTFYKNEYTWGLALGNEEASATGPDVGEVEMTGPQNIGKITANSTSLLQVKVFASYSSKTETFILNGAVDGTKPMLCLDNMELRSKFSPDGWYIKLAEEERKKWAGVRPLCLNVGTTEGFFYADSKAKVRAGVGFRMGAEISTGWFGIGFGAEAKLGAYYNAEIAGIAKASIKPFYIEELTVEASAKAGIEGCLKGVGCETLVAIEISGRLTLYFKVVEDGDKINVEGVDLQGDVEACLTVLGKDLCGDLSVDLSF